MYKTDFDFTSDLKVPTCSAPESRVLTENNHNPMETARQRLHHITASSRRRQEAVLRRLRKERLRRQRMVRRMEYHRLRNMVPSVAKQPLASKVVVIEEACRYIDYLHSALLAKLKTTGLPRCLRGMNVDPNHLNMDNIKQLVFQLYQKEHQQPKQSGTSTNVFQDVDAPTSIFERSRLVPSYLTAKRPLRKRT